MAKPSFVYVTHIASTPEKVFAALQDPEMTKAYWGRHRNASDWKPGSRWEHQDYADAKVVDIVGEVVENDPPRRLVITRVDPGEEGDLAKHSRVTFDVVMFMQSVRLTVTHEELEPIRTCCAASRWAGLPSCPV